MASEFKKLLWVSAGAHVILAASSLLSSFSSRPPLKIDEQSEAMNVMWAETAMMPAKTVEHKLPAPIIPVQAEVPVAHEEPKVVTKELNVPDAKPTPVLKEAKTDRKKSLKDALASLGELPKEEKRPAPKLDNFPSNGDTKKVGLPAAPNGGGTSLISNPTVNGYKLAIQKIITGHFVWFKKELPLYTEIAFSLNLDGEVEDPKVSKSSGEPSFDQSALRAVLKSSPLPKPPSDVAQDIINETFIIVFDTKRMKS